MPAQSALPTPDPKINAVLPALARMHARLTNSGLKWADKLEGSYIPQHAFRRYDPAQSRHPALRVDGSFGVDHHATDWIIQRHILREHGIVIAGLSLKTLIDPVRSDDLRQAALGSYTSGGCLSSPIPSDCRAAKIRRMPPEHVPAALYTAAWLSIIHLLTAKSLPHQLTSNYGEAHQPPLYYILASLAAMPADVSDPIGAY